MIKGEGSIKVRFEKKTAPKKNSLVRNPKKGLLIETG